MIDIFKYSDYRKFLYDWYEKRKQNCKAVSYRMIARHIGYKSPSYFTMILQGKINMSLSMCLKFCTYMKLKKKECDYFQNMLLYCNSTNHEEKQKYFEKMRSFKESSVHIVSSDQYRYYEKWYHAAIRAVLDFFPFKDEYEKIGKLLIPRISAQEVKESIGLLTELKLIYLDKKGFYRMVDESISSGYDVSAIAINTFLFNSLRLSESALGKFSLNERNFSCLTLGISEKGFSEIRQEIREFRKRIMNIAAEDKASRIYQLSLQLFPLSHEYRGGENL